MPSLIKGTEGKREREKNKVINNITYTSLKY